MATFSETFGQANGALANGWANDSALGGSDPVPQVISHKASTNGATVLYVATKAHGLTVSGDWQMDCDISAPLIIGDGGVTLWLLSDSTFNAYGYFVGNAAHIMLVTGGTITYLTNTGRTGEGNPGVLANHVRMTHTAAGVMTVYLDGVFWNSITDTSVTAGNLVYLSISNNTSPTNETTVANLTVQDYIGAPVVPSIMPQRRNVPSPAVHRAASW